MTLATMAIGSHVFHSQLQQTMSDCHYYHTASEEFYSTPLSGLFMYVCMYVCIYLFEVLNIYVELYENEQPEHSAKSMSCACEKIQNLRMNIGRNVIFR